MSRHASPLSLLILSAVMALGLSGVLGKPSPEKTTHGPHGELVVEMPAIVRNGDFFDTRIRVHADQRIGTLQLEVATELWREITVNSMIPAPSAESFHDGYFRFEFGSLEAGDAYLVKIDSQVNPRLLGDVQGQVRLLDAGRVVAEGRRVMKVLP